MYFYPSLDSQSRIHFHTGLTSRNRLNFLGFKPKKFKGYFLRGGGLVLWSKMEKIAYIPVGSLLPHVPPPSCPGLILIYL